jgi:anaphase-promoting complex subunit 3
LLLQRPSEENTLLLATCYYRNGQAARAAEVLSGATRPENRYLLACCCFQQGQLVEAENALLGGENFHIDDASALENVPAAAAGLYLLGRVCRRGSQRQQAVACFVKRCALCKHCSCSGGLADLSWSLIVLQLGDGSFHVVGVRAAL